MYNDSYFYTAQIYDHLMKAIDYAEWAEYLYDLMIEYVDEDARILELACGSCMLTEKLQKSFNNRIIATDLSINMLKQAPNKKIPKVCCTMAQLPVKGKFDVIFSAFDSINYLLDEEDVRSVFKQVYNLLEEEGIFTFDASLESNSINNVQHLNRKGKTSNIKYSQKSEYKSEERIHYNEFEIKLDNGKIVHEIHRQKIYPLQFYFDELPKAGFFVMESLDSFSFEDVNEKSERVQFVVKKERD